MFGTLGGPELFLILIIALIVFGPRKLPEIGKSLGKTLGEFRRASHEFRRTIENEVETEKLREATRIEPPRVEPVPPPPGETVVEAADGAASAEAGAPNVSRETPPPPLEPK